MDRILFVSFTIPFSYFARSNLRYFSLLKKYRVQKTDWKNGEGIKLMELYRNITTASDQQPSAEGSIEVEYRTPGWPRNFTASSHAASNRSASSILPRNDLRLRENKKKKKKTKEKNTGQKISRARATPRNILAARQPSISLENVYDPLS